MHTSRKFLGALPLLIVLPACASMPASGGAGSIRFMTYNIHAGQDASAQRNIERVAELIRQVGADIVLLQEVDRRTQRAGGADHLAELERLTGMHAAFGKSLDYQGGDYGIALLSRWPLDTVQRVPLAVHPPQARSENRYEPRIGLYARITTPLGPLHVLNTHVDPAGEPTYRHQEMIGLLAFARRTVPPTERFILSGDLNARDDTAELAALTFSLTDAWQRCGDGGAGHTFPASAPDRRIDYVLMRGLSCTRAEVVSTQASDHRPLLVTIVKDQ
jgi:endonuclease/exonuclease/phosphatase family metal-dependent hydrolase